MSTPDQRARDKDRDAAIEVVEAAWADGQIVEVDRDKRVEELLRAQTLGEVQMLVHDLQPPPASPSSEAPVAAPEPEDLPSVHYGPPSSSVPRDTAGQIPSAGRLVVPLVVVVVVAIAVVGGIVALVGTKVQQATGTDVPGIPGSGQAADVLSVDGYQDLLAAVADQTGSTTAFSAVLYPTYAVVEVPVDDTTDHEEYWYWNGADLTSEDIKSTASSPRTDLADLDPQVVVDLVRKVRRKMPDETSWYAIVRAPDEAGAVVWVYASNDYHESVYLGARPDGTVTWDSTEH